MCGGIENKSNEGEKRRVVRGEEEEEVLRKDRCTKKRKERSKGCGEERQGQMTETELTEEGMRWGGAGGCCGYVKMIPKGTALSVRTYVQ